MTRLTRITILIGSAREDNVTSVVCETIRHYLEGLSFPLKIDMVDPRTYELSVPDGFQKKEQLQRFQSTLKQADGVIFATPEYDGSFSSVAKLLVENMGYPSCLSGKPVALVGVASGEIGAVKALEHLRSVMSHVGAWVLPFSYSVAKVNDKLSSQGLWTDEDAKKGIEKLADGLMNHLFQKNSYD